MAELWSEILPTAPPPGVTPNFADPQTRTNIFIVVYAVFTSLVVLFVSLRLYAKMWIIRSIGWDDCECASILGRHAELTASSFVYFRNGAVLGLALNHDLLSLIETRYFS